MFKIDIDEGEYQNYHFSNNVKLPHLQYKKIAKTMTSHIFKTKQI